MSSDAEGTHPQFPPKGGKVRTEYSRTEYSRTEYSHIEYSHTEGTEEQSFSPLCVSPLPSRGGAGGGVCILSHAENVSRRGYYHAEARRCFRGLRGVFQSLGSQRPRSLSVPSVPLCEILSACILPPLGRDRGWVHHVS